MVENEDAPPVAAGDEVKPYKVHVSSPPRISRVGQSKLLTPSAGLEQISGPDQAEAGADSSAA